MSNSRAQKILNDLVQQRVLSPAGLAWLTLAVDPWHDNSVIGLEGLPDQGIGNSVTFQVVQELSISKNTAFPALGAGNWSVRIGNFPTMTTETVSPGIFSHGVGCSQLNNTSSLLHPIAVQYANDGTNFADVAANGGTTPQGLSIPAEYLKGDVRVLGVGIEVINTTSALHKQGLVSYCRMTQPDAEGSTGYIAIQNPANAYSQGTLVPVRTLPKNLQEMALYPGFAQDEAKEGYYAPVLLKFEAGGRHYPVNTTTLLLDDDPTFGNQIPSADIACHSSRVYPIAVLFPGNTQTFYSTQNMPLRYGCDSNVCMFSGLSDETTLTLRVRFILERYPSDAEGQMLVIATPTAVYDPVALELYSRAVQRLPAGVPFSENPAGEWWAKMVSEVANAAAPFLSIIHPGLGVAAKGVGAVAGSVGDRMKTSRKKKTSKLALTGPTAKQVPSGAKQIAGSPPARKPKPLPTPPARKK